MQQQWLDPSLTSVSVPTILEVLLTPHLHPDAVVISAADAVVFSAADAVVVSDADAVVFSDADAVVVSDAYAVVFAPAIKQYYIKVFEYN